MYEVTLSQNLICQIDLTPQMHLYHVAMMPPSAGTGGTFFKLFLNRGKLVLPQQ